MMPRNVVCLALDLGNSLEPEHISNIEIVAKNLEDFNNRFQTDFYLFYDTDGYTFEIPEQFIINDLLNWFVEGIGELLALSYSPTRDSYFDLNSYLNDRKTELDFLHSFEMYNNYRQRYIDYAPLGFLEEDSYFFIKENLTNLILDYSRNFN